SNTLPWGTHDWAYYFQAAHGNLAGYKGMLGMSFDGAAMGHAQLNDGVFTGWKRIYDDNYHPEANHAVEMGEDFEDAKSFHKAEVRYFSFHYGKVVIPLVPYLVEGKNSNKSYIEGKLVFHRGGASSSSRVEEVDLVAYQSYNQVVKAWMTAQYHDGWGWRLCTFDIQGKKWIGLYAPFNGNNQDARIAFTGRRHISNEAAANGFDRTQQLVAIEYEHLADPVSANNGIKNQEIYDTLAPYITIPAMQDGGGNKYYSENYKPTPAELGAVDETTVNKTGSTYEASISKIPYILANGCMEIARYVDFHLPGSTADYDARFAVNTAGKLTQHHATEVADVAQSSHSYSDLSNGAGGGKNYTRRLRGGTGDTIFHETVQSSTYRLATGNEDTIDLLRLIASPDPTQVQGYIGNQRIMTSNYGVFTGAVSAVDLQSWSSGRRGFKLTSTNATYAEMAPIGADSTILWTEALRWYGADDWRIGSSKRIYHQGFKPTASDIGAGTFLGDVWTKQGASWRTSASSIGSSATGLLCYAPDKTTIVGGAGILSMDGVATSSFLGWGTTPWSLANSLTVNANSFTYKGNAVYHAGNKPTATDVGAAKGFRNLRSPSSGVSEWHRIAISPGGNWGSALFTVKAEKSGIHTTVNFTVTTVFNKNPKITLLGCSHYLTAGITEIAVEYKDGDPYADMYVLIKATANNIEYEVANNIGFVDSWVPATALGRDTIVMNVSAADKSIDTAGGKVYSNGVEVYSPLNKPTTGDIGALPLQMNQYGLSSLGLTDADFSGLTLPQAFDRIGNAMLASAAGTAREK
ncbi:hypothetical protein, partial [Photobacterium halotolerans]|uniref:hypothetical protein n=1 Tax=Photobacterium halotolerans TaxID=265726 RepID=UPI0005684A0E